MSFDQSQARVYFREVANRPDIEIETVDVLDTRAVRIEYTTQAERGDDLGTVGHEIYVLLMAYADFTTAESGSPPPALEAVAIAPESDETLTWRCETAWIREHGLDAFDRDKAAERAVLERVVDTAEPEIALSFGGRLGGGDE